MTAMYSAQVRTVGESMARSMTDVHAFKIFMDEPEALGGKNAAPSPLDFILAAHAGCLNYMTHFIANEMGIEIEGTEITLGGSLDPAKFAGTNRDVRAGYQSIDADIRVRSRRRSRKTGCVAGRSRSALPGKRQHRQSDADQPEHERYGLTGLPVGRGGQGFSSNSISMNANS